MNPPSPTGRILYFCPDFPQPSGGTKTLYRHVSRLRAAGVDAAIVHQQHGFVLDWHTYAVPHLWLEDRPRFGPDDTLVIPEVMPDLIRQTKGFAGRRAVISLSWLPTYARLLPGERWQDHGITHVLTTSPAIRRHLEWSQEIDVTLLPEHVDPALYHYAPDAKQLDVTYLTRKDASGAWLAGVIARRQPNLSAWNWTPIRGLPEAAYAERLRAASIYLTTTLQEGAHISVLEAMACGCLVVGFSAIGGTDAMIAAGPAQNCISVENGNLLQLGQALEEVLIEWLRDRSRYDRIIANALHTARAYQDAAAETAALLAFFAELGV